MNKIDSHWLAKKTQKLFPEKFNLDEAYGALICFKCILKRKNNLYKKEKYRLIKKRLRECGYL